VRRPELPAGVRLAKDVVRITGERGAVHDDELLAELGCDRAELRAAIGIAMHWHRIDRCGDFLVAVPPRREGRRAA
jgi:hypothetical protein